MVINMIPSVGSESKGGVVGQRNPGMGVIEG